jgi:MFS family permease
MNHSKNQPISSDESSKGLNPVVVKLGLVSFFADISSEMLYPITPLFLTQVLGASFTSVGFIEGVAEATASLLKGLSGRWADKLNRRKEFVVLGYFLAALGKPLMGLSTSSVGVLFARALDRTGKGLRTAPRDAILSASTSSRDRGSAFGWHRAMDSAGAFLGPLFAIWYLNHFNVNSHSASGPDYSGLRSIYYWSAIPGLAAVFIALFIRDIKSRPRNATGKPTNESSADAKPTSQSFLEKWRAWPKDFRRFVVAWTVFSLTNSSDVFLLLKAKDLGFSPSWVIALYCFYNFVYAVFSPYLGGLSDRFGRKRILVMGLIVFSAVYLGIGLNTLPVALWLLFALYGVYMAATDGVGKALASDLVTKDLRATALGLLGTTTGLATVFASTTAGALWQHAGSQWTFIYGAAGALLAAALWMRPLKSVSDVQV